MVKGTSNKVVMLAFEQISTAKSPPIAQLSSSPSFLLTILTAS